MACDKGFINVLMLGLAFMLVFTAFQTWGNIQSQTFKPSSIWSKYSMLRAVLSVKEDIYIDKFPKLIAFLKRNSVGYEPKKSKVLSIKEIGDFLATASDETYLLTKKAMIDSIKNDNPNFNGNAYISLAIVYVFFALFNWTAPSVISLIGPKFSMLIGGITYLLFIASFSIPRTWLLYLVSCIIGIGAALIWTGQGNYLALNSRPATISKNSGIFWALLQLSMFIGNTFVYFAFRDKDTIDAGTRQIVVWTLAAIALGGLVVILFFPKPPEKDASDNNPAEEAKEPAGPIEALKGAVRLSMTKNMLLLCVTFLYTGLELGFWSGVYSSAIGSTTNMPRSKELIGVSGIFIGLGEVLGGAAFGILGNKTIRWGRDPIVIAGFVIHVASFFIIFLNLPIDAPFGATTTSAFITSNAYLAILCSFLLGLGDACYNTQIYSVLCGVYASDSAAAFAIFKFTQSVAAAISFAYASYLNLYGQLGILLVSSILGTITFVWVEWRGRRAAVDSASTS